MAIEQISRNWQTWSLVLRSSRHLAPASNLLVRWEHFCLWLITNVGRLKISGWIQDFSEGVSTPKGPCRVSAFKAPISLDLKGFNYPSCTDNIKLDISAIQDLYCVVKWNRIYQNPIMDVVNWRQLLLAFLITKGRHHNQKFDIRSFQWRTQLSFPRMVLNAFHICQITIRMLK